MLNDVTKNDILLRLRKIEGQIRGLERMVDQKRYCVDILNQIAAVRRALDGVSMQMLKRHMQTCVSTGIKANKGEPLINELIDSLGRFVR